MEEIQKLKETYDEAKKQVAKDRAAIMQITNDIKNQFMGGISVKEYTAYHNQLGFHGGSLGHDYNAVAGIEEIEKLYEKIGVLDSGGFSRDDMNFIADIAINANTGFISDDIIDAAKDFLIGGALMMMFEDGFANTQKILNLVKNNFDQAHFNTVHLYQFDTLYIPASYLLTKICEKL